MLSVISSSPGELNPVFQTMLANATNICDANFGMLFRCEDGMVNAAAMLGVPPAFAEFWQRGPRRPGRQTAQGRTMETKQTVHIVDVTTDPAYVEGEPVFVAAVKLGGFRTILNVPMLKENELIGFFSIYRQEVRPFTDKQVELVQNFATQAVIAIENARLLNELRQRTDDLSEALEQQTATSEVLRVISSSPGELEPVFQAMLENATRICEAKFGILFLSTGDGFHTAAMHNAPSALVEARRREPLFRPPPTSALGQMAATKRPTQIADMLAEPGYFDPKPGYSQPQIGRLADARTVVAVPLLKDDQLVGAIVIYRQEVRPFTDKQVALVSNFAAQAVIAIENTRLLNELRQRTDDLSEALEQQTATSDVLQVISSSPGELEPVFNAILDNVTRICEAQFANLFLYGENSFRIAAQQNPPAEYAKRWRDNPVLSISENPQNPLTRLVATKRVVNIDDLMAEQGYIDRDPRFVKSRRGGRRPHAPSRSDAQRR